MKKDVNLKVIEQVDVPRPGILIFIVVYKHLIGELQRVSQIDLDPLEQDLHHTGWGEVPSSSVQKGTIGVSTSKRHNEVVTMIHFKTSIIQYNIS